MKIHACLIGWTLFALAACGGHGELDQQLDETDANLTNSGKYNFKTLVNTANCMDVAGGSISNGAQVQEWTCNGSGAQTWQIQALDTTYYKLVNPQSGKCLDIAGNLTADGTKVELWTCNGGSNQAFRFVSSNGFLKIVGKQSGKCVDVAAANPASGTKVQLWTCNGTNAQTWNAVLLGSGSGSGSGGTTTSGIGGVVSSSMFDQMFPNRNAFYTYSGLTSAGAAFSQFASSSDTTIRKREAAAFLANAAWEGDQLRAVREYNTNNYCNYCDRSQPYGCPAGTCNYYGRGPLQISWNFNYKAAGDFLGIDLLNSPDRVATDATVAWKTALWFWMTNPGAGSMTPHTGITCTDSWCGFGQTIRSLNGSLECDGKQPSVVQARVDLYKHFCDLLGVSYGNNLFC
jgi:hypothetical protein